MALVIVDTDILIDALEGREPSVGRIRVGLETGTLATSAITAFELLSGASDRTRDRVDRLLAALPVLPLDQPAGRAAAEARRELEKRGTPIGMADYLIAGVCLSRSALLLTRNTRHFSRVPNLRLDPLFASID